MAGTGRIGPKGPELPPSGEGPRKMSSVLAQSVGDTVQVAKGAVFYSGSSDLEGRVTSGPAGDTAPRNVVEDNMLQWRGF